MLLQRIFSCLVLLSLVRCASPMSLKNEKKADLKPEVVEAAVAPEAKVVDPEPTKKAENTYLICKASKSRFHYDWSAGSLRSGQEVIDQNNVRYEFRSARKPAGDKGENLKVGECGWAEEPLTIAKTKKSQVTFKSLSDEATQTFYKMKTGKVFKFPVRQTKNGLVAVPGGIRVIR